MKLTMADQFLKMGRLDQAEALYKQVLAGNPDNLHAILSLGTLYTRQDKHDQAVSFLRKAIELEPANAHTHLKLARRFAAHEQFEQASDCYRRVIELWPRHIGSLIALVNSTRQTEYSKEIRVMEELYGKPELPENDRRRLAFALGKAYDDLCEYDKAFRFFEAGNLIARAGYQHSNEAEAYRFRRITEHFDADFFQRYSGTGIADASPIIVTGMPRSGTTLVEQILANHPDVYGAGEAENLHHIVQELEQKLGARFPDGFNTLDATLLRDKAIQYVSELKSLAGGEARIVDKTLGSVVYLGLINVMLPNVKIIHCNRDPRDQGLSFFQKDFGAQQVFSYDLEEIGQYYNRCQGMMDYWDRRLPGRIYPIQYEDMVSDLETSVRGLLEHCDLPFDDACLSFHNTKRVVRTASHIQVRQPLYASSVGRWKNYERQLQPLIAELGM